MRFAIIDPFGCSLSFAARIQDEGHEVKLYHDKGKGRERSDLHVHVGEGIVPLEMDYEAIVSWASDSLDSLVLFAGSGLGAKADELRDRGLIVVGGGTFCDRLENDRLFGQDVAQEAGAKLPPYEEFSSLSAVKKRAKSLDKCVFFKSDKYLGADATHQCETGNELEAYMNQLLDSGTRDSVKCILQEKIEGVALSTGRWWSGRAWVGPYEWTIEHKAFMNDDVGPSTGCSLNAIWMTDESTVADKLGWENLSARFRSEEAPPGFYDINSVIDKDGNAWFLEHTPRCGYDSEPTSLLLVDNLATWLWYVGTGQGGAEWNSQLALATRISVPPYTWEDVHIDDKQTCMGTRIMGTDGVWSGNFVAYQVRAATEEGILEVASPEGIVGLAVAIGDDVKDLGDEINDFARSLKPKTLQFRTDAAKVVAEDAKELAASGVEMHGGLS